MSDDSGMLSSPELEKMLKDMSGKLTGVIKKQEEAQSTAERQTLDRHRLNNQLGTTLLDIGTRQLAMQQDVAKLTTDVGRITGAILGDNMGNEGLANRIKAAEELAESNCDRISKLETERSSTRGNLTLIVSIGAMAIAALTLFLKLIGK